MIHDHSELDTALISCADEVTKRGLSVPAIFFLEMYKPLTTIFGATCQTLNPFLIPILGAERSRVLLKFLESRENVEKLLVLIESRSSEVHENA